MQWWEYVIVIGVLLVGIYAFFATSRYVGRILTKGSSPSADSMYQNYGDSVHKQYRYARHHGGEWTDDEGPHVGTAGRAHSQAVHHTDRPASRAA